MTIGRKKCQQGREEKDKVEGNQTQNQKSSNYSTAREYTQKKKGIWSVGNWKVMNWEAAQVIGCSSLNIVKIGLRKGFFPKNL